MKPLPPQTEAPVIVYHDGPVLHITLNRPKVINSLNLELIRLLARALDEAEASPAVHVVLIRGSGDRGFCAGGDIKALSLFLRDEGDERALTFFAEEYALDLRLHRFPKPVVVLADGITMGGGLGIAAGADLVLVTERTRMAMPETRIGFFPDVGATGWMFDRCPAGYPEFLGLTGYEMVGAECLRLGFATHLIPRSRLPDVAARLALHAVDLSREKPVAVTQLKKLFASLSEPQILANPVMDEWVQTYFHGGESLPKILGALSLCSLQHDLCKGVFQRLADRSPTALVLTLKLLRHNEGRPLTEVFSADLQAARFIVSHPDYLEGVRARLIDKDNLPHWQPDNIAKVERLSLNL